MRLRHFSIAAVVATAGATLVGCAPWYAVDGCTPAFEPGAASNEVATAVSNGDDLVDLAPIAVDAPQQSILGASGDTASSGDAVRIDLTVVDGATGSTLSSTAGTEQEGTTIVRVDDEASELGQALECATSGSTTAFVSTYQAVYGDSAAQQGVDPQATVVAIIETHDVFPGRADGWPQPAVAGMPSISLAPDGRPGITWAGVPAPTELTTAVTIQGSGDEIEDGDTFVAQYTLVAWGDDTVRQSSWDSQPATLTTDGVIDAFREGVVGQQVGSQVLIAVPADALPDDGSYGTEPLLFVVDLLDVDP